MSEPVFISSLSLDEIKRNFTDMNFFTELMDGLGDALAFSKGKETAGSYVRCRELTKTLQ